MVKRKPIQYVGLAFLWIEVIPLAVFTIAILWELARHRPDRAAEIYAVEVISPLPPIP